ncbi:MAG TPA: UDP-N-acetylmuramoyl-L-alanyl-D-glutamate--2,6-diaminopimelate ligase [Chloroflexota bacterium]|nr:UDP-N-acetylmuramoyl-L-alanyl-D-glutamate--2,6-diaminopimelate ligase [Chloroflexota bacterium]
MDLLSLGQIVGVFPGARVIGDGALPVARISFDSRHVRPGDLFFDLPRVADDGSRFLAEAFQRGACAAVVERSEDLPAGRPGVVVPSARRALGLVAAALEDWPSRRLRLAGITGTDGKTTTSSLLAEILRRSGRAVGVVTTVDAQIGHEHLDTGFHTSTPDAPDLQRYLRRMVDAGMQDAVLEATSHGLAQERVAGCDFDLAVITNVTSDHLDYHRTAAAYLAAKLKLFQDLAAAAHKPGVPKGIVYNLDDRSGEPIAALWSERRLSYALERRADVRARAVRQYAHATAFDVETPDQSFPVQLSLPGWYNVANALAAIAAALLWEAPVPAIQEALATFSGVPGRLERIDRGQDFDVFVDFAHTANSLEQVLKLKREQCRRRLSVVFGCAGLRDRDKRPAMGEVAGRLADRIYLTAEDPRTEDLTLILEDIAEGCRQAGRREGADFWKIPDRAEAIARAIDEAATADVVLVTGKGHERSMCFGHTELPWSDPAAVRDALDRRIGSPGVG